MLGLLRTCLWFLVGRIASLRYHIQVLGLEQLGDLKGPTLILPNHPGYNDPALVLAVLWPRLHPRPMLFEELFQGPVLRPLMKIVNAIRVPDLDQPSAQARARAQEAVAEAITALRHGDNVILWPSGRTRRDARGEVLGGARAASDILQAVPQAKVLLVRTRGLWGSSFSHAYKGKRPKLGWRLLAAAGWLVANLIIFMPRRQVSVMLELLDRQALPDLRRESLNPWLEAWYNEGGPEAPTFIPYHAFLGPRRRQFPAFRGLAEVDLSRIKPETRTAVAHILADKLGRPLTTAELKPDTTLDQLGLDSLDRMEVSLAVEHHFGFTGDQVPVNLGQLWALAQGLVEREPLRPVPPTWFRPAASDGPLAALGNTLAGAFVARALAHPRDVATADDLAGVLTYERLLVGALTLSRRFARLASPNVGLMLPSSVACDVAVFGLLLAGKLPVLLNWTTGPALLAHAARTMGLTHVVTSRLFVDRTGVVVAGVNYLFLEDVRGEMGRWELLRTLLSVRLRPGRIRAQVPRPVPDQPALVLFTSGSEKAPKAVPLTHTNLFTVLHACYGVLGLTRRDAIVGFLPAFHSFGIGGIVLLPILGGMRVIHHPDPTDAAGLVSKISAYRPTVLMGTPTFLSYILDRAAPGDLASLRVILLGAEKCPPAVFEHCARLAPAASVLEGYGITECSPVVSVNRPGANRRGSLGQVLPGVEVCVVDLDSHAELPRDQQGLLLVSGRSVFPGYLNPDAPSPFVERDGRRWYVTGDLGWQDADGYLWFAGRLRRFLKAGGEMISLPALEEPFTQLYPPTRDGTRVAVEGIEMDHGRHIVLFTTEALTLREANARLQQEGFRGVMRLDEVRHLPAIPVLGTGKTDYKALRALLNRSPEAAPHDAPLTAGAGPSSACQ
jgi:long-chain-fatty-acid--[acyl-carrier-protein] ligase